MIWDYPPRAVSTLLHHCGTRLQVKIDLYINYINLANKVDVNDGYTNFTEPERIYTSYKNPGHQFKGCPTEGEADLPSQTLDLEITLLTSPRPNQTT